MIAWIPVGNRSMQAKVRGSAPMNSIGMGGIYFDRSPAPAVKLHVILGSGWILISPAL
jgi:hypothetical protein